jgi:hypothetical protein
MNFLDGREMDGLAAVFPDKMVVVVDRMFKGSHCR